MLQKLCANSLVSWMLLVALGAVGCGGGPEVVPVSGRINLDGQPFAGARINTQPVGDIENPNPGPGSFGTTDQDGRYTLELATHKQPGAVVGTHRVTIVMEVDAFSADPTSDLQEAPSRQLPLWFSDGSLTIDVPEGGTDSANLNLSTKQRP